MGSTPGADTGFWSCLPSSVKTSGGKQIPSGQRLPPLPFQPLPVRSLYIRGAGLGRSQSGEAGSGCSQGRNSICKAQKRESPGQQGWGPGMWRLNPAWGLGLPVCLASKVCGEDQAGQLWPRHESSESPTPCPRGSPGTGHKQNPLLRGHPPSAPD